ncbi:MAG TPA: radical SAM protein [Chitinivibrionales bacterium]|nr:radical SAM protein [Chitinivibrionales bacterium]
MPNVLFTQRCVRSCPYCFARKHMSDSSPDDIISWENVIYLADFLEAGGERVFSILGGEPTLHPDFVDMVLYLIERRFHVRVFTSGIMSESKLRDASAAFAALPQEALAFICNVNDPGRSEQSAAELPRVEAFLAEFGSRIAPGFNIYQTDFSLDFICHHINRFGLKRSIRLGLTHPIPGQQNLFISLKDIDLIIKRFFEHAPLLERLHIRPGMDCGFPLCRFTNEQIAWFMRYGGECRFGCGAVIDIGPDMSVWPCFPLSAFDKRSIFEFNSLAEMRTHYDGLTKKIRVEQGGIYLACDTCGLRRDGNCAGGCVAHALEAFRHEPNVRAQEVYA